MMSQQQSGPQLVGETVTASYVADPSLGHGQFRLENHSEGILAATILSAWLELEGGQQPLVGVSLFDLDQEESLNPDDFRVDAGATMRFLLGFPRVAYEPHFGESIAVGLRIKVNDIELQARSPIKLVRRIPYDH